MMHKFKVEVPAWSATIHTTYTSPAPFRMLSARLDRTWAEVETTIFVSQTETLNEIANHFAAPASRISTITAQEGVGA